MNHGEPGIYKAPVVKRRPQHPNADGSRSASQSPGAENRSPSINPINVPNPSSSSSPDQKSSLPFSAAASSPPHVPHTATRKEMTPEKGLVRDSSSRTVESASVTDAPDLSAKRITSPTPAKKKDFAATYNGVSPGEASRAAAAACSKSGAALSVDVAGKKRPQSQGTTPDTAALPTSSSGKTSRKGSEDQVAPNLAAAPRTVRQKSKKDPSVSAASPSPRDPSPPFVSHVDPAAESTPHPEGKELIKKRPPSESPAPPAQDVRSTPQPTPAAKVSPDPAAPEQQQKKGPWKPPMNTSASPDHLPNDEPDTICPSVKYYYDAKTGNWKEASTMIRVLHPNRGLSQGAMRVCFGVQEIDEYGFSMPMVAKMFRRNIRHVVQADYFSEGEAQCLCEEFAERFNQAKLSSAAASSGVEKHNISFLQCYTIRIPYDSIPDHYKGKRTGFFSFLPTDSRDVIFTMEPKLDGNFTKYTNNYGDVYEGFEERLSETAERRRDTVLKAAEAFSHFTLVESGGSMLVCDLQGVESFLTDPQIHTEDGKGLGMGNMGQEGIDKWVDTHRCNDICRGLRLQPLDEKVRAELKSKTASGNRNFRGFNARLKSQSPLRPQDIIPLPKPLSEMTEEEQLEYAVRLSNLLE